LKVENNKIGARFICLDEPAFFELIDTLYERLKGKDTPDKWVPAETVMLMLNISSPTGDSDERDHSNPAQADHPFRAKLTT